MSSTDAPLFSVVMATYGRGRHILPSIRSVLDQSFADYELLVVGDCCTDDTEQAVATLGDPRIRWMNLPERCGSQSAPNNAGIIAARGTVIAYLGHDDIWEPDHLAHLQALYAEFPDLDFGVAGMIMHLPAGVPGSQVTGMFEDDSAKNVHFFPPSSVSHRREVFGRIGGWNMPAEISSPVDMDYFRRAAQADLRFASTGKISVHKFNAAFRYLSYLEQTSDEQAEMLGEMGKPGHAERVEAAVTEAKIRGTFMTTRLHGHEMIPKGQLARENAARKGLLAAVATPLGQGGKVEQQPAHCAYDWQDKPVEGIRWSRLNPSPRMLLPRYGGHAAMEMEVFHRDQSALETIDLFCNGMSLTIERMLLEQAGDLWRARFYAAVALRSHGPSVLHFHLNEAQAPSEAAPGIGVGDIWLVPAVKLSVKGMPFLRPLEDVLNRRRLRKLRHELSRLDKVSVAEP